MSQVLAAPPINSATGREKLPTRAEVHALVAPFARADSFKGYRSFVLDVSIYATGIAGVLLFDMLALKILGGLVAGLGLVNLGSLSHEAAHRSVVKSRLGNKVIAVVSFTMILFNYRLWVFEHHVMHHGRTQVKLNNFLSPLTMAEFRALPRWRRALFRAYHSPGGAGILLYFLLQRWPTVHFIPGSWLPEKFRASAWRYAALMVAYAATLVALLVTVSTARGDSVAAALLCGFVLPFTVWFITFSTTAFLQHTNPELRWYRDLASLASPPESTAVQVGVPHFVNYVTHYVLEHSVHHVNALIPHYHLRAAQAALANLEPGAIIYMPFTLGNLNMVLRRCRLYDFEAHAWTDFNGTVTAIPRDTSAYLGRKPRAAAVAASGVVEAGSPGVFFAKEAADAAPGWEPEVIAGCEEA